MNPEAEENEDDYDLLHSLEAEHFRFDQYRSKQHGKGESDCESKWAIFAKSWSSLTYSNVLNIDNEARKRSEEKDGCSGSTEIVRKVISEFESQILPIYWVPNPVKWINSNCRD